MTWCIAEDAEDTHSVISFITNCFETFTDHMSKRIASHITSESVTICLQKKSVREMKKKKGLCWVHHVSASPDLYYTLSFDHQMLTASD